MAKSNTRIFVVSLSGVTLLVLLAIFSTSYPRLSTRAAVQQNQSKVLAPTPTTKPKRINPQDAQEFEARFPATDYDAPEPTNQDEQLKRRNRNRHYDGKHLVMKNPTNSGSGMSVRSEVFDALPALPVTQSDVILTADVLSSEAHLSNDKKGVYSEFNVQIAAVLKGAIPTLSQTNLISISRFGGMVRYPSGRTLTYEIAGQSMPALSKKYLFFLRAVEGTYEIITGYEIGPKTVQALDFPPQFQAFNGTDSAGFLNKVRNAMANNN